MKELIIIGNTGGTHIADSFARASIALGVLAKSFDVADAYAATWWRRKLYWHILGRRPVLMAAFNRQVVEYSQLHQAAGILGVGFVPLSVSTLARLGDQGLRRMIYLTDDPWCNRQRPAWIFKTLPYFDYVFTPRQANIGDLRSLGCRHLIYLPFGYDPALFYPESEPCRLEYDIVFFGGADRERLSYVSALLTGGFKVALYGSYWERFRQTRPYARGRADPALLRRLMRSSKIALCLVRHANRDGHSMRSFEIPAMRGCMLTEDTAEHRAIFGAEGEAVIYFKGISEMLRKARWLCDQGERYREQLAHNAHMRIVSGKHTYQDRLTSIIDCARGSA